MMVQRCDAFFQDWTKDEHGTVTDVFCTKHLFLTQ
jgi:hypothetical protein